MFTRRQFNGTVCAAAGFLVAGRSAVASPSASRFAENINGLETISGGRLGVAVLDSGNGALFQHRGDERFPMCSTFKLLVAAAVLKGAGDDLTWPAAPRSLRQIGPRHLFAWGRETCRRRRHVTCRDLRSRDHPERQYCGKPAAKEHRRPRRSHRFCAKSGRAGHAAIPALDAAGRTMISQLSGPPTDRSSRAI